LDAVVPDVRRAVADVDPRLPLSQVQMVNDYLAQQVEVPRDSMLVVGAFGVMALVLAAFGIYGIVAYGVMQRTYEIGIRMALGAKRSQVLGLVLRQSTIFTVGGMIAGLAGAAALTRFVRTLLFGLTPFDPLTFVAVAVLFLLMAMIASYIPARRATKIDPLVALRAD
jgi:ABC-type antimicrobial peptide transport system permease subunit